MESLTFAIRICTTNFVLKFSSFDSSFLFHFSHFVIYFFVFWRVRHHVYISFFSLRTESFTNIHKTSTHHIPSAPPYRFAQVTSRELSFLNLVIIIVHLHLNWNRGFSNPQISCIFILPCLVVRFMCYIIESRHDDPFWIGRCECHSALFGCRNDDLEFTSSTVVQIDACRMSSNTMDVMSRWCRNHQID